MNEHVDELGAGIVNASTQAAMAYLGDPTAADAPHYLEVWAKYLRGLDPVHRPLITKELVDYWCLYGTPEQLLEKTQLMREAGVRHGQRCSCPTPSPPARHRRHRLVDPRPRLTPEPDDRKDRP